ncbi:23S rRNA (uracil(1939)-C(5))-methyltransferase RlmD [Azoarcus sp. KH32C]|uniref:23S rRNA (uracil(1939)-C(5))-methyltransferase RlmD n=1 Tax=Azoarcus sp. KH32C TaxID=748247 RepID=UPI000238664B|nr:23S rRNA (uracil(1939)-C(5))-methyltransferase RlmD [Azoarcus sp. KH32C]BAL25804.1 23S rRNA 5-methyluridine methyltransferase [Azoarcus sp. KH32C]
MPVAVIESLDHEGRGVTHVEGKVVFVDGALLGERVEYVVHRQRPSYELADVTRILKASAQRVAPKCPHYGVCGGCSMQHLDSVAQVATKQRVLENALWHVGKVKADIIYPAIHGPAWGYRYRARIGVRLVPSKGGVLVGFHERRSSYIADMRTCPVLPPGISAMLPALHELIAGLSISDRLPQIEIAVADTATVLVFRNLLPFKPDDERRLAAFADQWGVQVWQQPGTNPASARPLHPKKGPGLAYTLPEFGVTMDFLPTDFTQVNVDINRLLIRRSMQLLDPQPGERIADLFCGLGNFSLPIASRGATMVGVEGSEALVARARENARRNGLAERCEFHAANLFEATEDSLAALGRLDKLLIDPPREGAIAVVKALSEAQMPPRIVYVSCNPATLARDAAVLVREKGYVLKGAGIANMFPQTSHVESIALFERG